MPASAEGESEEHPESCDSKERPREEKQEDCEKAEPSSEPLVKGEAGVSSLCRYGKPECHKVLQKFLKKQVANCMKWSFWGSFVPPDVSKKKKN